MNKLMHEDILIVDDTIANLNLLAALLKEAGYSVRASASAELALQSAKNQPPALILLDIVMPGMDGFEVCRRLKQDVTTSDIPIIFISAQNDSPSKVQGFNAGGVDYINKPFQREEVLARVRTHLALHDTQSQLEQRVKERTAELEEIVRELRATKEILARAERNFRALFEHSPTAMVAIDSESRRILQANDNALKISGYSLEEILALTIADLIHPDSLADYQQGYEQLSSGLVDSITNERRYLKKDGSDFIGYTSISTLKDDHGKVVRIIGSAIDITERRQAELDLLESHKRLRELSTHLQTVREEERIRIARELHDQLGQMLTAVKLDAKWLASTMSDAQPIILDKVASMSNLIDDTLDAIRRVAADLRPTMLDYLGLVAAVEWLAEDFGKHAGIAISLKTDLMHGKCQDLCEDCNPDGEASTAMYRIVQECLTNIARHAEANHVMVSLCCRDGKLILLVSDNGKGMDVNGSRKPNSYGMVGMKERAHSLGGTMKILSILGEGTSVEVVLPIKSHVNK